MTEKRFTKDDTLMFSAIKDNGKPMKVKEIKENKTKRIPHRIMLKTPTVDYCFNLEQWKEFKEKVNKV